MTDLVKLYNPANAAALTPEQIAGLQKLTSPEIKELAVAYPNMVMNRAYLLIIDSRKSVEKQLPALSTFENLYNLREKNNLRWYVAYNFRGAVIPRVQTAKTKVRRTEVRDLSNVELMELPGFKTKSENGAITTTAPEVVTVTKVKRGPGKQDDNIPETKIISPTNIP